MSILRAGLQYPPGHTHPEVVAALTHQANQLWHVANVLPTNPRSVWPKTGGQHICRSRVLCNSGAEANEAALKLARKVAYDAFVAANGKDKLKDFDKTEIIALTMPFTGAPCSRSRLAGRRNIRKVSARCHKTFATCLTNDIAAAEKAVRHAPCRDCRADSRRRRRDTGRPAFLKRLRELCDQHKALLILMK